jgi:hypothetical protein
MGTYHIDYLTLGLVSRLNNPLYIETIPLWKYEAVRLKFIIITAELQYE